MKIVFYDGECGLCQRSIQLIYNADRRRLFYFAPLNGLTYKNIYGNQLDQLTTLKFFNENMTYQKSEAILELLRLLGGYYKCFYILKFIPSSIRDYLYDLIAVNRNTVSCIVLKKNDTFLN